MKIELGLDRAFDKGGYMPEARRRRVSSPGPSRHPTWGDPPPRSALREAVDLIVFALVFCASLALAAHVGLERAL